MTNEATLSPSLIYYTGCVSTRKTLRRIMYFPEGFGAIVFEPHVTFIEAGREGCSVHRPKLIQYLVIKKAS